MTAPDATGRQGGRPVGPAGTTTPARLPPLRLGSLCTGYGGLDMAVTAVLPATIAWVADPDPGAAAILAHHWPGVPNLGDITAQDWTTVPPVDVLCAGYPCQPFSQAGQRKGTADERHLWPHIVRAIRVLRPRLAILENVANHLRLGFADVLADLAGLGFDAEWCVAGASEVGAAHQRRRLFAIAWPADADRPGLEGAGLRRATAERGEPAAHPADLGHQRRRDARGRRTGPADGRRAAADPESDGREVFERQQPGVGARDHVDGRGPAGGIDWGDYAPAIDRWARVLGRPAPAPTEPGRHGRPRLSPAFVEWLMGLDEGHVTGVPGLTRNQMLTALGNGVVPQQGAAAVALLLDRMETAA